MNKLTWMKAVEQHNDYEFLMHTIGYHAAPTLKGVKVSSLINFNGRNLMAWRKHQDKIIQVLGVACKVLKKTDKREVVLFYNHNTLEQIIRDHQVFLGQFGYYSDCLLLALDHLSKRFEAACPHEIGVFLGYPVDDVKCFLACDKTCLRVGYWKVYHNESEAVRTFKIFDQAKEDYHYYLSHGLLPSEIITTKLAI